LPRQTRVSAIGRRKTEAAVLHRDNLDIYSVVILPLAEKALIERIRRLAGPARAGVTGIGDDCAVLGMRSGEVLLTTDFSLEGVHFRREWHPPESVGHRCLTRGLSDIAAMGGEPIASFVSLALPPALPQNWVDRFFDGLLALARRYNVKLAGGDTAESPGGVMADIVLFGSVPKGKAILRSGAKPGDRIYVTGELGGSAAAVSLLLAGGKKKLRAQDYPAHFFPNPRVEAGKLLREYRIASAMIDISDGLSTDLHHICEESGVGAEVQAEALPLARVGRPAREVGFNFALHGGEAYELLFTAPERARVPERIGGVAVTQIGQITRGKGMVLVTGGRPARLRPQGWEHFR
jgi:thiamine-monophosphate kinase